MAERRMNEMSVENVECGQKEKNSRIIDAPYIDQSGAYPTGCESVSAVMLLRFLGMRITVDEFIGQYLDQQEFQTRDGELYGPDPWNAFCGSPYDEDAFGCYAPVIVRALNRALQERAEEISSGVRYEAIDETGTELSELCRNYIDHGMPVVCWACIHMREPVVGPGWRLLESGESFTWISNEHCMLLVGYDETGYWFNDPYDHNGVIHYPKETVENRHRAQHKQAAGLRKI